MMGIPELNINGLVSKTAIVQGGMGVGISMSRLAAAVAEEGGIGVIAAAMVGVSEPDCRSNPIEANIRVLRKEIRAARKATNGVLGINIIAALTLFPESVRAAIEEGIDVIFSGGGLPLDLPQYLNHGAHTKLVPIVSSARAARLLYQKWLQKFDYLPDAFVLEGPKAGGHLGFKIEQIEDPRFALEHLLKEVLTFVKTIEDKHNRSIPVIAAGGIFSGADIAKFLQLGAAGVQLGTRFVATHECDADPAFKRAYLESEKEDLVLIESPLGLPGRALKNQFINAVADGAKKPFKCVYHCIKPCKPENSPYCIALALAAAKKGVFKHGFAFAGANAHRVDKIVSVKELFESLRNEYSQAKSANL